VSVYGDVKNVMMCRGMDLWCCSG